MRFSAKKDPLHRAARKGTVQQVVQLMAKKPELIHAVNDLRSTILQVAIEDGNDEVAAHLIATVPSLVDARDMARGTPLHVAAYAGRERIVEALLAAKPELANVTNWHRMAPLHFAIEEGHANIVAQLLPRTSAAIVHSNPGFSGTTLHETISHGSREIVDQLLAAYPDLIDEIDSFGFNALFHAAMGGHEDMVARVLALRPSMIHHRSRDGRTALHFAHSVKVVDMLLAASPELIDAVNQDGETALHRTRDKAIAERLLEVRPELSRVVSKRGDTVLYASVFYLDSDSIDDLYFAKLLSLNPDAVRTASQDGETPFHHAITEGKYNLVELLQEKLSLDEIREAFAKCKQQPEEEGLRSTVVARCECLLEWLHKDVVGTVFEYLGFESPPPPPLQMKKRSSTLPRARARPVTRSLAKTRKLGLQGPLRK